jgi:hypothetical protein
MTNKDFFSQRLKDAIKRTMSFHAVDALDRKRAEMLRAALGFTADVNKGTADLGAALRMVLSSDQELFDEVSSIEQDKGHKTLRYAYDRMAKSEGGKTGFQRANEINALSGAGDNDLGMLYVEKAIKKRAEAESDLLTVLDSKRIATGTKSGKFPKSSNTAKCAFATVSADLASLNSDVDGGLDNLAVEANKFGGTLFLEAEAMVKLDAQHISQILDELTMAYRRGMVDQIVNGNGTPPNATGLATNATAITFSGNVTQTLIKMIAAIADVTRGGSKEIFLLTNTAGMVTLEGEKFINSAHNDLIEALAGKNFMKSFKLIEENVITTSGSSPDKTAPLYVGKKGDYLLATQTDPKIEIDRYSDFKAGGETARVMGFWTGAPYWNDSFAKTTIPSIY